MSDLHKKQPVTFVRFVRNKNNFISIDAAGDVKTTFINKVVLVYLTETHVITQLSALAAFDPMPRVSVGSVVGPHPLEPDSIVAIGTNTTVGYYSYYFVLFRVLCISLLPLFIFLPCASLMLFVTVYVCASVQVVIVALMPATTALCRITLPAAVSKDGMLYATWRRGYVKPTGTLLQTVISVLAFVVTAVYV